MPKTFANFSVNHLPKVEEMMLGFVRKYAEEATLAQAMTYSLEAGGKRIRPMLLLATLDMLKQPIEDAHYQVAGALEMIHTYSLIHDDLPAMDNDDLRRGKPTNHKVYGEGMAILAGDGLLTEAFHLVTQANIEPDVKVAIMQELALHAGSAGMIGGQVGDIEAENQEITLDHLASIHRRKTGALIMFAVNSAALLAQADEATRRHLSHYAEQFGIAFQIKDDILDVIGDEAVIGKKVGSDEALNKSTYTSILGMEAAKEKLNEHIHDALASLEAIKVNQPEVDTALLVELINKLR
ncbi:polyprenyl synthetase family protein [Vagococcus xieshaowenii]|uniref:Farnesyl diphosphate synthase n=1 Tax=Vagococcus xieshaowenii TaxID=2562451 RepID=A0AAJ5EGG0_9ENTE|nr:farnesyl diphosphate synthase [Vagococcus xieshaowenii]QCA28287.1 polyprenyl synthetase family protein [Vagococcus xieshaowenii]TFZ42325.1 polyprenyl synthetase family protein [Vagococcus xieshaowenii]